MKRRILITVSPVVLLLILSLFGIGKSAAEVNLSIGINVPLLAYTFHEPPPVVVVPGTYAYYVPNVDVDIIFYHGYWYRPHEGHWYKAAAYNGPWVFLAPAKVPRVLVTLPPDYRVRTVGHEHIPYGQLKNHWRTWEKENHWEKESRRNEEKAWRGEEKEHHKEAKQEHKEGKGNGKHRDD